MDVTIDVNTDDQPWYYEPAAAVPQPGVSVGQKSRERDDGIEVMVPPMNFAIVVPGVYRSGFPNAKNLPFLKRLKLRSIIILCGDEPSTPYEQFIADNDIKKFHYKIAANKEPFVEMEVPAVLDALQMVLDKRNLPCLIHCNKGTLRTGCLIGIIRKLQHWCLSSIFDEFSRFSQSKERPMDQEFIELFDVGKLKFDHTHLPDWAL